LIEYLWAFGLVLLRVILRCVPHQKRYGVARFFGRKVSRFFLSSRQSVQDNLSWIQKWSGSSGRVDAVFENFAVTLSDFLGKESVSICVQGKENLDAVRQTGRGVVFFTTHLGNWEMGGRVLSETGGPVTAVYRPYRSRVMQSFIQSCRSPKIHYLAVGRGAAQGVMRALRKGEGVALLGDRPYGEDGGLVSVCGRPTRWPRGPFLFSCRTGSPMLPGFVLMDAPGHYRCVLEEPLWPGSTFEPEKMMDKMAQLLGQYISAYPEQLYCFEPMWRTDDHVRSNPGV